MTCVEHGAQDAHALSFTSGGGEQGGEVSTDHLQEPAERYCKVEGPDVAAGVHASGPLKGENGKRARAGQAVDEEEDAVRKRAHTASDNDGDGTEVAERRCAGKGGKGPEQCGREGSVRSAETLATGNDAVAKTTAADSVTEASPISGSAAAPAPTQTTTGSCTQVNLPLWVKSIPVFRTVPTANAALSDKQCAALDRAKAYVRDVQPTLLIKVRKTALTRTLPPVPGIAAIPANPIPGIITGADPRVVNMMSRVYVGSIPFEVTDQHMQVVFGQFGYINNIGMNLDPTTGKHKGFCFVEYEAPESAVLALNTMDGFELGGRKLRVGRPNNYNPQSALTLPPPPKSRIYVSNVSEYVTEENITSIFEPFGKIVNCILIPDFATRKHKNYGYIEFEEESAAQTAVESMDHFDLGGLQLRVLRAVLGGGMGEGMKALQRMPPLPGIGGVSTPGAPSGLTAGALAAHTTAARIASDLANKGQIPSANETVAREENLSISSTQRYAIMQALARNESASAVVTGGTSGMAVTLSPILLVRNAVSAADVDDELREEFAEECSKFGRVTRVHVHVDKSSIGEDLGEEDGRKQGDGDVRIFVQFTQPEAAERARTILDGRWFGGRRVKATLYDTDKFHGGYYA